ncbi:MAG TPA: ribonuclease P protein component [Pseudogracilibacillus sp.]|nr:ribonuclease P protein component [Pseudogracilibacillus sp.]
MKKAYRIKRNEEFQEIFNAGKSFANRELVIYHVKKTNQTHFRIGLSVGKKLGNAVMRNQIKRYLREAFLSLEDNIKPDLDLIIIARNPTVNMDYHQIKRSLTHLLHRENLFKHKNK